MVQVETFECSETAAEPIEATEEAVALIESLGLEGQKALIAPKKREGFDQRSPYREMTQDEFFVYSVLCPKHTNVQNYASSPMPLRVLQIAAHASSLDMFPLVEVWDREDVTLHDPVLVAFTTESSYDSNRKRFILARWGEELETFAVLMKRALEKKRAELADNIKEITARVQSVSDAELIKTPSYSVHAW